MSEGRKLRDLYPGALRSTDGEGELSNRSANGWVERWEKFPGADHRCSGGLGAGIRGSWATQELGILSPRHAL